MSDTSKGAEALADRIISEDLSPAAKALGLSVAWVCRWDGRARLTMASMLKMTGIRSRTTLIRAQRELEALGVFKFEAQAGITTTINVVMEDAANV